MKWFKNKYQEFVFNPLFYMYWQSVQVNEYGSDVRAFLGESMIRAEEITFFHFWQLCSYDCIEFLMHRCFNGDRPVFPRLCTPNVLLSENSLNREK